MCIYFPFAQVRIAERSVEGRHARVNRILERAPAGSCAYLSSEMRFCELEKVASTQPRVPCLDLEIQNPGMLEQW